MRNFDITVATTIILFIALFPMAFIWLRRAHRIFIKKNYAEVALKNGDPPANPEKFAIHTGMVNLVAGSVAVITILGVAAGLLEYKVWSAMAGLTIWMKVFADFVVSRQAHPYKFGKDKIAKSVDKVEK